MGHRVTPISLLLLGEVGRLLHPLRRANALGGAAAPSSVRPGLMGTVKVRLVWRWGGCQRMSALGGGERRWGAQVWWRQHARPGVLALRWRLQTAVRWSGRPEALMGRLKKLADGRKPKATMVRAMGLAKGDCVDTGEKEGVPGETAQGHQHHRRRTRQTQKRDRSAGLPGVDGGVSAGCRCWPAVPLSRPPVGARCCPRGLPACRRPAPWAAVRPGPPSPWFAWTGDREQ